jgi:purine-binding chemotaxis protein CheW
MTPPEKDWAEAYRRLERAREGLARQRGRDAARDRLTLEERARVLARPLDPPVTGEQVQLITFRLGAETYGIEARFLQAVFRLREFSPIPGARPPISGVTPWRGELLTILDLRGILGVSAEGLSDLSRVLVLGQTTAAFGVLADAVDDVRSISTAAIQPPAEGVAIVRDYLRGITGDALLVLDAAELLRLHG